MVPVLVLELNCRCICSGYLFEILCADCCHSSRVARAVFIRYRGTLHTKSDYFHPVQRDPSQKSDYFHPVQTDPSHKIRLFSSGTDGPFTQNQTVFIRYRWQRL
jgi:hypothetical protein